MFSEILRSYDELISSLALYSVQKCVDAFLEINHIRLKRKKELLAKNEFEAYKRAQQLVKEFLVSDNDSDFFDKIGQIRSKTLAEYAERFENKCKQWDEILDKKEEQFILLLKERLAEKPIVFGHLGDKKLEWFVIGVDPFQHTVKLFLKEPYEQFAFKESGYTVVEDGDSVFDCPELACGWKDSDARSYLNTTVYNNAFSNSEKEIILKTKRHINKDDFLIPNDISDDYVYLLDLDEFLMLPIEIQRCVANGQCDFYWLAEQKSRGWDDTGELPKIYAVECKTGNLIDHTGNDVGLVRFGVTISLDYFIKNN